MRDWLQHLTVRRLILSGFILLVVTAAALVWGAGTDVRALRERAYPIPSTDCQKPQNCDERALQIDAREAVTADNAFDLAVGQLALNILGIGGVGLTLYYAHLAWGEAGKAQPLRNSRWNTPKIARRDSFALTLWYTPKASHLPKLATSSVRSKPTIGGKLQPETLWSNGLLDRLLSNSLSPT